MAGIIFVRERRKVEKGEKKPRFKIVGVSGADLKLYAEHVRKVEIEAIAKAVGATVTYLPTEGEGKGGGKDD